MKKLLVVVFCLFCLGALSACGGGGNSTTPQMVGRWSKKISTDSPSARSGHSAVWTGTEMIIWGGIDGNNNALNDGKIYNPATGTWRTMSSVNAPSARYYHTALWTGSKMLIWGGSNSYQQGSVVNSGGIYDPSTDTWTQIPSIVSPVITEMFYHTAVWTGTDMIVWGGNNGNVGWKYNPTANSWAQMSSQNAPLGCYGHTAIWTGSDMIVWGGRTTWLSTTYLNTGSKYNPVSDTWSPITIANAPLARTDHSAVWTGTEMIIWGGHGNLTGTDERLNTGSRYNPSTDIWVATSLIGAPVASSAHTSVWTGSSMIVFGRLWSQDTTLNGSGIYDPQKNSWTPLSIVNPPITVLDLSAIWTGSQMIMWGGKDVFTSVLLDTATIFTL